MEEILLALEILANGVMNEMLNTYWVYKGDASTQIEDIDKNQVLADMLQDTEFIEKVLGAIRNIGVSQ